MSAKKIKGYEIRRGIVKAVTLFANEADAVKVAAEREGVDGYIRHDGQIVGVRTVVRNNVVRHYAADGRVITWGSAFPTREACKRACVARAKDNLKTYESRVKLGKRELEKVRKL